MEPTVDQILLSGGSLLRTPGRSSCRSDLEKALNPGLSWHGISNELTAASAVSLLPQLQDFGRTGSIHFSENLVQPLQADFLQWQTHARKLIRAYAGASARFILKVAFVAWASRWQRFPEAESVVATDTGAGGIARQDDAEVMSPEIHEKVQPTKLLDPQHHEDSHEQCYQELLDAQQRAALAERQVLELEAKLHQLSSSGPVVQVATPVVAPPLLAAPGRPARLVRSLLAHADCQALRVVFASWRGSLQARLQRCVVTRKLEERQAASAARSTLLAWREISRWGAQPSGTLQPLGKEGVLALRAFLCWASGVSHQREGRQAAEACAVMADRLGSALLRPAFGGWKGRVCQMTGNRRLACTGTVGVGFVFRGWQSETFGRYSVLEMRRAHASEDKWKRSATTSLAMTAWHRRAQQSSRLRLSFSAKELAFQRLVLGAWRLALPDLQPGATPPRTRLLRPRPSPESARVAKLVCTPEDVSARAEAVEAGAAVCDQVQAAPPTLLQQLHVHATRLLREKIKDNQGQPPSSNGEPIGEDAAKGHPKYMPTPSKCSVARKHSQPSAEDRPLGPLGAKTERRKAVETTVTTGRGRAIPRHTSQGKAPVAQSRLKLQELQIPQTSPQCHVQQIKRIESCATKIAMAAAMTDTNSPWTYNVLCGLCATGFYCTGAGLFQMTVLPSFILLVGGSNFDVGFAEGLQGLTNLIFALPVGYIADKWSRRACIRIGASLSLLSGACLLLAVLLATADNSTAFAILCAALGLQGICDGIMNGPLVALMDDSCPAGRRSDVETMNAVVYGAASSVGPLVGLVVFLYAGNTWSLSSMKIVIALGVLICQMAIFPCFFMDDRRALGECSEAVHLQERLVGDSGGARELVERNQRASCFGLITVGRVRLVLFMNEVILCLGAGMTVKFFPVFFKQEGHINPAVLQAVFASLSALTVVATLISTRISKCAGRLQVIIPCYALGITCTILLGLLRPYYTVPGVMLPVFLLRCCSMWGASPLLGSIIADYTPKAQRGRWKALGSITAMGWSGSAAVGGALIDHFGYGITFAITGCMQSLALPTMCSLMPLVAKESELLAAAERTCGDDSTSTLEDSCVETGLSGFW
ncbi:TDRD1 [Symbiodinium sp. CCMP2592]|nr:TDRD1 [Symbiodinium sp. CCMP2592]